MILIQKGLNKINFFIEIILAMPVHRRRSKKRSVRRKSPKKRSAPRRSVRRVSAKKSTGVKVSNLSAAGKSKAKIQSLINKNAKLFGIPKGTNRARGYAIKGATGLSVKVNKNRVLLTGKGPGGVKLNRFVGVAK